MLRVSVAVFSMALTSAVHVPEPATMAEVETQAAALDATEEEKKCPTYSEPTCRQNQWC